MTRTENMIAVIACAGSKKSGAGRLVDGGREVMFAARPDKAPADGRLYRRPDDPASSGRSFRDMLEEYNRDRRADNPLGLLPAWELYTPRYDPPPYRALYGAFGADRLFILSAGWGLVPADYLLPCYDITFTNQASDWKRRRRSDRSWRDFAMLPRETPEHVVFFGGKDYAPFFSHLTEGVARREVFYNSARPPSAPGCKLTPCRTAGSPRTWHYECAMSFISGGCCV